MDNNSGKFTYTYSAKQNEELKRIREKYSPADKSEDKMEQIRKLDKSAERPGLIVSLAAGIIGCLTLGTGMCCTMLWADRFFVVGIIVGIIGMVLVGIAYPLYKKITAKQREKIAPRILKLSDEIENKI